VIRVAIATLGCKTNSYESAAIAAGFDPALYELVDFEQEADIYVVNTCTVTGRTDFKSRNLIRKALWRKQSNPSIKVVVTGCYAQRHSDQIRELGDIDLIADNQAKQDIALLLARPDTDFTDITTARDFRYRPVSRMPGHSRAFQKIQDGCDRRCAYCAVPYARGPARSAAFAEVLDQARRFVAAGHREIVLGGVNLGLYRDGELGLAEVAGALQQLPGLELFRLSSMEPDCLSADLLDCLSDLDKFCPHFHIPLQSGSDSVLRRMGRPYDSADFRRLIASVLKAFPDAAIGLDVIAGFPGETEADFVPTLDLIKDLDIAYLHVFPFSRRPGTLAATMDKQLPRPVKEERVRLLTSLGAAKKERYRRRLLERAVPLRGICEKTVGGYSTFLSDHYIRGYSPEAARPGELCRLTPRVLYRDGLR